MPVAGTPRRAPPPLVAQGAEVAVGVPVETGFEAEPLGVEAPSFAEGVDVDEAPEIGQAPELFLQGDLQVVAGHRFMEGQRLEVVERPGVEGEGVHPVVAGASTVELRA